MGIRGSPKQSRAREQGSPVPVSEVEEFWAKLQQIGGANIKGSIVTTGPLQAGALKFAQSKGLSVVRILPDDQMVTEFTSLEPVAAGIVGILYALAELIGHLFGKSKERLSPVSEDGRQTCVSALTEEKFRGEKRPFYGLSGVRVYRGWGSMLMHGLAKGLAKAKTDSHRATR